MKQLAGKCHCGKNAFNLVNEPEFQFVCYCKDCRMLNGGGHLCGIVFDQKKLKPAEFTHSYRYQGGSGKELILHFCPTCSTQLYAYPTHHQGKVVVRANCLIDFEYRPQKLIFTESAYSWDKPMM